MQSYHSIKSQNIVTIRFGNILKSYQDFYKGRRIVALYLGGVILQALR